MFTAQNIWKAIVWIFVHTIAFIVLVWFFLGINPIETYEKSTQHLKSMWNSAKNSSMNFNKATSGLSRVAGHHLNEMDKRTQGIDPYEGYSRNIDKTVRKDMGM